MKGSSIAGAARLKGRRVRRRMGAVGRCIVWCVMKKWGGWGRVRGIGGVIENEMNRRGYSEVCYNSCHARWVSAGFED